MPLSTDPADGTAIVIVIAAVIELTLGVAYRANHRVGPSPTGAPSAALNRWESGELVPVSVP